jgi:hypothetical protein
MQRSSFELNGLALHIIVRRFCIPESNNKEGLRYYLYELYAIPYDLLIVGFNFINLEVLDSLRICDCDFS